MANDNQNLDIDSSGGGGSENIMNTNGLTLLGDYSHDLNGNKLTLGNGTFELSTTTDGFLMPRLTTAQMNAISTPDTNLLIFNTDLNSLYRYNGAIWVALSVGYGVISLNDSTGSPVYYSDLASANTAAVSGDVIKLHTDITETGDVELTLKIGVVYDLNGYTYTHTGTGLADCFSLLSGVGTVTIKNGTIRKTGSADGMIIYNTASQTWVLTDLICENTLGQCFALVGNINADGSTFTGNGSNHACYTSVASKTSGGRYINTHPTGGNSLNGSTKNVYCESVGGSNYISGDLNDSTFVSVSGDALSTAGTNVNVHNCNAYSDSGTAARFTNGYASSIYAESQTGIGINAGGCLGLYNSIGISRGGTNKMGIAAAKLNVNCYAESDSYYAWFASVTDAKLLNCSGKVLSGTSYGIFCNVNTIEIIGCIFYLADSAAYGIGPGNTDKYITGTKVKGSANLAEFTTGSNLWTATVDSQGNSAQL